MKKTAERVWSFRGLSNAIDDRLGNLRSVFGEAYKVFDKLVRVSVVDIDVDNDDDVTTLSRQCEKAKDVLATMKVAMASMQYSIDEYHDELLFRSQHSGVTMRNKEGKTMDREERIAAKVVKGGFDDNDRGLGGDANKEYDQEMREVRVLVKNLERALNRHEARQGSRPTDWGFSGDLGHAKGLLQELIRFLQG